MRRVPEQCQMECQVDLSVIVSVEMSLLIAVPLKSRPLIVHPVDITPPPSCEQRWRCAQKPKAERVGGIALDGVFLGLGKPVQGGLECLMFNSSCTSSTSGSWHVRVDVSTGFGSPRVGMFSIRVVILAPEAINTTL